MSERRRAVTLAIIAATLVVGGALAEWLYLAGHVQMTGLVDLATGWAIGGCGILAWAMVPRSRVGPLLVVASLAWFAGTPRDTSTELGRLATAALYLYAGPFFQAIVTWPTGRTSRPPDVALVIGGYMVALLAPLWQRDVGVLAIGVLLTGSLSVQLLARSRAERAVHGPAVAAGLLLAGTLVAKRPIAQAARELGLGLLGSADVLWSIALVAAAALLTWGVVALERRRAQVTDLVVELDGVTGLAELGRDIPDDGLRAAVGHAREMLDRNDRLRAELDQQVQALEESRRRLVEAGDAERRILEQRLRAGPASQLDELSALLGSIIDRWAGAGIDGLARLHRSSDQLALASAELATICRGLDPVLLADGLGPALIDLAERSPIPVAVQMTDDIRSDDSVALTLYYVASEAIANVIRHARATRATLRLATSAHAIVLDVEDDGVGGADPDRGTGLRGLRDRLEALGGSLRIAESATGGTLLGATVPSRGRGSPR